MPTKIIRRPTVKKNYLADTSLPAILQRVYCARGVKSLAEIDYQLKNLLPYHDLLGIDIAATYLADAIAEQQRILIIGDFDADGATSSALGVSALRAMGAKHVAYLVPNRFAYGYGLTPEIVDVAQCWHPDWIVTVDNGIASHAGVDAAHAAGIKVLVTDHHLPGATLPAAEAIVNPNQPNDRFPSKHLAGVGVIFYLMLALRALLRERDWFSAYGITQPNLAHWLDLVALGTVADVVPLDQNNRILVQQGLQRMRHGNCRPGIQALLEIAKRTMQRVAASDLGFAVGPRLNAAGRLDDMSLGIECLLAETLEQAQFLAQQLDQLNKERRDIENDMQKEALQSLQQLHLSEDESKLPIGLCLYQTHWHQGVIGILASRIKDRYHRPVIAFAQVSETELKGSARSVAGVHIRDVLDTLATQHPGLITKFGGHAMAAGLSLPLDHYQRFASLFATEIAKHLQPEQLRGELLSDGELHADEFNLETAELLQQASPWGQAFPEPLFDDVFTIIEQRLVGQRHLKLTVQKQGAQHYLSAIAFNIDPEVWPNHRCEKIHAAYRLDVNHYQGLQQLQLMIEHIESVG